MALFARFAVPPMSIARPARNCGPTPRSEPIFATWRAGFERRAAAAGITPDTLASARPYLRPLPDTLALDRRQSEFGARVWEYLDSAVNAERISGRACGHGAATRPRWTG